VRVRVRSLIVVLGIAAAMTAAGAILLTPSTPSAKNETQRPAAASRSDRLTANIARAQDRLKNVPGDYVTWAALGTAYIEKARITADPSFYPKAEGALRKSLEVRPTDNDGAVTGLGALANARHDFAAAKDFATKALAINSYSADAYAVLTDAETQLGNAAAATDAVQHLLDLKPGLSALTRGSYDLELRGRVDQARSLMTDALETAYDPADVAFCRYQLGELAFNNGDLAGAAGHFTNGLEADPTYLPLVQGRAKVAAARGDFNAAIADYANLTARMPTPSMFSEYAELLRAAGRTADADAQLTLAAAAQAVFAANGGTDDLVGATLALAQGKPAEAVKLARQEWQRRQFSDVADTLAWALHAAGNDKEALDFAKKAGALGARNAKYSYHLGMIELALGDRTAARADLKRAIDINPHFSPLDAPIAVRTLTGLGS
jgi:tetratricopeptide (TPR) repeat protein